MSLPTRARFFNIYGDLIGDCFVNAGWRLTYSTIYACIKEFPQIAIDRPDIHYVELYDFSFPIEMISDIRTLSSDDGEAFIEKIFENVEIKC